MHISCITDRMSFVGKTINDNKNHREICGLSQGIFQGPIRWNRFYANHFGSQPFTYPYIGDKYPHIWPDWDLPLKGHTSMKLVPSYNYLYREYLYECFHMVVLINFYKWFCIVSFLTFVEFPGNRLQTRPIYVTPCLY